LLNRLNKNNSLLETTPRIQASALLLNEGELARFGPVSECIKLSPTKDQTKDRSMHLKLSTLVVDVICILPADASRPIS
jgi:hypothetical protein